MLIKIGESFEINNIEDTDKSIAIVDQKVLDNFGKFASSIKKIAPKAQDFLYFSAIMMHAAEASAINDDGTPKLTKSGAPVEVSWEKKNGSWKWKTNDPSIFPYKNSNRDIFPEEELKLAHKKWVGKPLCIDHQSSSVDHVRGFIVDTYYDEKLKRVISLCALDKKNYPELARKVETGYSNDVSMGTAVETAICTDCGKVAKAEHEFCKCMRAKSCYGEINVGLNPIELSIVVNGADPKAKIKHIVAAAQNLNSYIDKKQEELDKVAKARFNASISVTNSDPEAGPGVQEFSSSNYAANFSTENIDELKTKLNEILEEVEKFNSSSVEKETANDESSEDVDKEDNDYCEDGMIDFATDHQDNLLKKTASLINNVKTKLSKLSEDLSKLSQEEIMSTKKMNKAAYFQGTEEPTPGQAKYKKDPLNEKLRDEDKHMQTEDTGPVDGMHPGVKSVDMSELERKKMLARATAEERAMRRQAAVNNAKKALESKAYFQGAGEENEPTPGKTKYTPDPMNEKLRDEDKHMTGHKPFPEVGDVEKGYPGLNNDELETKKRLQRAALKATFVKASNKDGSQDLGKSAWEVYLGDKLVVRASVNDITDGKALALYSKVATREFGTKLLEKVKAYGADTVSNLYKKAQEAPAAPPAPPAGELPPAVEEAGAAPADKVETDPKKQAVELMKQLETVVSDLGEAVRALAGEEKEMGADLEGLGAPAAGGGEAVPPVTASLQVMRKELNGSLRTSMKEAVAGLKEHYKELKMITEMYDRKAVNKENESFVNTLVADAFKDAKASLSDTLQLMGAFVKYARGTEAMVKKAEETSAPSDGGTDELNKMLESLNGDETVSEPHNETVSEPKKEPKKEEVALSDDEDYLLDEGMDNDMPMDNLSSADVSMANDDALSEQELKMVNALRKQDGKPEFKPTVAAVKETSKAKRAEMRAKLAADAIQMSDMIDEAHKQKDGDIELDVAVSDDLDVVEGLEAVHDAMLDVANAPVKVRKEAEAIQKLVSEGKLAVEDVEELVKEGVDPAAVKYWKELFSVDAESKQFAAEMVKEHVEAKVAAEIEAHKVKLSRAYQLAYDMVNRGLCHRDSEAINSQVDEIVKLNDEGFNSLKRVVAKNPVLNMRKEAGLMPQVGVINSLPSAVEEDTFANQLTAMFANSKKRYF